MLFSQIRDIAFARCENKGQKVLNGDLELLIVVQDFCRAANWGWRQKQYLFDSVQATAEYALPTDVDSVLAVHVVNGDQAPRRLTELVSHTDFVNAVEDARQGAPLNWYLKKGDESKITLDPVPDEVMYRIQVTYNAIPLSLPDDDVVPMVPERFHKVLIKGLERTILRYTLGEESAKYQTVSAEYDQELTAALL